MIGFLIAIYISFSFYMITTTIVEEAQWANHPEYHFDVGPAILFVVCWPFTYFILVLVALLQALSEI